MGPARVLCCHTGRLPGDGPWDIGRRGLYPSAAAALAAHAPGAVLVDVSGDDYGYWDQIRRYWTGHADLILVEQDVEITAAVLPAFEACPGLWCTFRYAYWPTWPPSTDACGCVRFRAQLQRRIPAAAIEAGWGSCEVCGDPGRIPGMGPPLRPGCWRHVDAAFLAAFASAGLTGSCRHEPVLAHRKEAAGAPQRP